MESQKKLSQLIGRVYDYNEVIQYTSSSGAVLSDAEVARYVDSKALCFAALSDIVVLSAASPVSSSVAQQLLSLLRNVKSSVFLKPIIVEQASALCKVLNSQLVSTDITVESHEDLAFRFQNELCSLKEYI